MTKEKNIRWYILLLLLSGLILFSFNPYILSLHLVQVYDYKRLFNYLVILLACAALLFLRKEREKVINQLIHLPKKVKLLFITLLLFMVIASINALYPLRSLFDMAGWFSLLLLTTLLSVTSVRHKVFVYKLYILVSLLLFLSVLAGHYIVITIQGNTPDIDSIVSFVNPRMLNHIQAWISLPLVYLTVISRNRSVKLVSAIAFSLIIATLIALEARGTAIAIFGGLLCWALFDKTLRSRVLMYVLLLSLAGYLIKLVLLAPFPEFIFTGNWSDVLPNFRLGDSGRIAIWLDAITNSSVWGYGGDAYVCNAHHSVDGPHNSFILIWFNWGLGSALCYILLLFFALNSAIKTSRRVVRVTALTMLSGFAYSLVTQSLTSPLSQLTGCLSIAIFWGTQTCSKKFNNNGNTKAGKFTHGIVILTSVLIIITLSYRSYQRVSHNHFIHIPPKDNSKLHPQVWLSNNCVGGIPYLRDETAAERKPALN